MSHSITDPFHLWQQPPSHFPGSCQKCTFGKAVVALDKSLACCLVPQGQKGVHCSPCHGLPSQEGRKPLPAAIANLLAWPQQCSPGESFTEAHTPQCPLISLSLASATRGREASTICHCKWPGHRSAHLGSAPHLGQCTQPHCQAVLSYAICYGVTY